jgi:hypothetical protein
MAYQDSTHLLQQARTLVRAIEALDAVIPENWFEQIVVALVRIIYLQRLRRLAGMIPRWAMRWVAREPGGAVADGDRGVVVRKPHAGICAVRGRWLPPLPRWRAKRSQGSRL